MTLRDAEIRRAESRYDRAAFARYNHGVRRAVKENRERPRIEARRDYYIRTLVDPEAER